jgi:hypothetical protein
VPKNLRQPDRRWPPGTFGFLTESSFDQHWMGIHRFEGERLHFSIWLDQISAIGRAVELMRRRI